MLLSAHLLTLHIIRGLLYLEWEQREGREKKKRMEEGKEGGWEERKDSDGKVEEKGKRREGEMGRGERKEGSVVNLS